MDKPRAISHFLYYLEHHPALAGLDSAKVLLGHTADYEALTGAIAEQAGDHPASPSAPDAWIWKAPQR
jgi:hypothetical protein